LIRSLPLPVLTHRGRFACGIQESVSNGEVVRGHSGGGRTDAQMLWDTGYTFIVQINANPAAVTVVSNEIITSLLDKTRCA
jgi:hypothetical protein